MRVDGLIAEGRSLDVVSQAEAVAPMNCSDGGGLCTAYEAAPASSLRLSIKIASTEHEQLPGQINIGCSSAR